MENDRPSTAMAGSITLPINLRTLFDENNFDERRYLDSNPDVKAAIQSGHLTSAYDHFVFFGKKECRSFDDPGTVRNARRAKLDRLKPLLRDDINCVWIDDKPNYLTDELRESTRIIETSAVSRNDYDGAMLEIIERHSDGIILDCGAGYRSVYYENVVNFEIVDYPSTDVIGVGELLPFQDNSFDAVFSVAVLEHVRDPFRCAREISRVLKPGGQLYCSVPFLQPFHGYPHHYFNATPQGIRRLFEDDLIVNSVGVIDSMHPIWAISWILDVWQRSLPPKARDAFNSLTVSDLLTPPSSQIVLPYCQELPPEAKLEIACATVLTAMKPH